MGMKRNGLRYIMLSKIAVFGSAGRRNRFPCGRNRVPGTKFQGDEIWVSGNRLLLGRNRVPNTKFQERIIFKMWEPGSPREEPVTNVLNFKTLKTLKIHIFQTVT